MSNNEELYARIEAIQHKWNQENYVDALAMMNDVILDFPTVKGYLMLEKAQILCKLERYDEGLDTISDSIQNNEGWTIDKYFDSPVFGPLQESDRFKTLRDLNATALQTKANGKENNYYIHYNCNKSDITKALISLHGNYFLNDMVVTDQLMKQNSENTRAFINDDSVALCQVLSSKVGYLGFPYWHDYEFGAVDANRNIESIKQELELSNKDIILSGYSAGAGVIVAGIINGTIPNTNIILAMPHLPRLQEQKERLMKLDNTKYTFFIYSGTEDFCLPFAKDIDDILSKANIPHTFLVENGQNHQFRNGVKMYIEHAYQYFLE